MSAQAWRRWAVWIGALALVTVSLLAVRERLDKAHVTLVYLLLILLGTVSGGRRLGLTLAGLAFVLFNWFFLRPYGTLRIDDPLDWSILVAFIAVCVVGAQMLHRLQREAVVAAQRAEEVDQFAALGAETLSMARSDDVLRAVAETIRAKLQIASCQVHPNGSGDVPDADPLVAWVRQHGGTAVRLADATTHLEAHADLPGEMPPGAVATSWLLPLRARGQVVGVLELEDERGIRLGRSERRFLRGLSYYAALGIERTRLVAAADRADSLRAADRLKDALLASVSHDLRTPLTTIKALAHDMGPRDERALVIEQEADRLNRLVAGLLDLSRMQGGAIPMNLALNPVDDLVGAAVQRLAGVLGQRKLDITFDDDSTLLVGRFDFVHALRVLVNLIENAHKYSPPGSAILLHVAREAAWLRFTVADRGAGVPIAERERIFEPFYRPSDAVPDSGSAGLGLSISRRLAELQGGTVVYAPRDGGGSEFIFSLPAADLPADAIQS